MFARRPKPKSLTWMRRFAIYKRSKRHWLNSRTPVPGGVRSVRVRFSKPWTMESFHDSKLETGVVYDSRDRGCDAPKAAMPDVLASLCRNRILSRTRFPSWDSVLAAHHGRLPDSDACGSRLSSEETPS